MFNNGCCHCYVCLQSSTHTWRLLGGPYLNSCGPCCICWSWSWSRRERRQAFHKLYKVLKQHCSPWRTFDMQSSNRRLTEHTLEKVSLEPVWVRESSFPPSSPLCQECRRHHVFYFPQAREQSTGLGPSEDSEVGKELKEDGAAAGKAARGRAKAQVQEEGPQSPTQGTGRRPQSLTSQRRWPPCQSQTAAVQESVPSGTLLIAEGRLGTTFVEGSTPPLPVSRTTCQMC